MYFIQYKYKRLLEDTTMNGFMYYIAYVLCFFIFRLPGKIQIEGKENIPKNTNFIIVANHVSLWDPWIIASIVPITTLVHWFTIEMLYDPIGVKQYLPKKFNKGIIGYILARIVNFTMKHTHTIKVAVQLCKNVSKEKARMQKSINSAALREANKVLSKKGGAIGIFSQRGRHGSVDNTSSSCLLLARKNNALILPIHLSKNTVIIMEPIDISNIKNISLGKKERKEMVISLMNTILDRVN